MTIDEQNHRGTSSRYYREDEEQSAEARPDSADYVERSISGFFVLKDHSLVSFHFGGLTDVDMDSFQSGNILFGLTLLRPDDSASFRVELDFVMDMSGAFTASSGRVASILPCDSNGKPA